MDKYFYVPTTYLLSYLSGRLCYAVSPQLAATYLLTTMRSMWTIDQTTILRYGYITSSVRPIPPNHWKDGDGISSVTTASGERIHKFLFQHRSV